MKKVITILSLVILSFTTKQYAQGSLTPSDWLQIAFEDATGAKDTVVIGHYYDTCYYSTCQAYVSAGIDTAFGEVNIGPPTTPGFAARIENLVQDGAPYNMWTKRDIRMCDTTAEYALWYNFFNDPLFYYIRFYNYTTPIIATINIHRTDAFLPDSADLGCFCVYNSLLGNPKERFGNGWSRWYSDTVNNISAQWDYDAIISPNLIDTLNAPLVQSYVFAPYYLITDIIYYNAKNEGFEIFPIPTSDYLNVKTSNAEDWVVEIFNTKGEMIYKDKTEDKKINVAILSRGIYLLKLNTGKKELTFKFIKT